DAILAEARGPSWRRPDWPPVVDGDLVSALDGNWAAVASATADKIPARVRARGAEISEGAVQQATRDSVRALMMIRAYRIRGHFHARLDPLGIEPPKDHEELHPATYGFTEADYDRNIFIDGVLGVHL